MQLKQILARKYQYRYRMYRRVLSFLMRSRLLRRITADRACSGVGSSSFLAPFLAVCRILSLEGKFDEELAVVLKIRFPSTRSQFFSYILGDFLLANRCYAENSTFAYLSAACRRNCEIDANLRMVNYIVQRYGYKSPKLDAYLKRLAGSHVFCFLSQNALCMLLEIAAQRKKPKLMQKILPRIRKRASESKCCTLYLAHLILDSRSVEKNTLRNGKKTLVEIKNQYKIGEYHLLDCDRMFSLLITNRRRIENLFREYRNRTCVVGNAPCETGTGHGQIIDSFALVCRINNYSLDYPEDYGSRTDLWVRVANGEVDNANLLKQRNVVFASNNFANKKASAYDFCLPCLVAGNVFTSIPSHVFRALMRRLKCLPSTGMAFLYWIYTVAGPIPRENLFGFSHLSRDETPSDFRSHYYSDKVEIGVHIHNFATEAEILREIIR